MKSNPVVQPKERISAINGLRGIAILSVVFTHLPIHAWFVTRLHYIVDHFSTGVTLFFILSGFVLYRPFLLKGHTLLTKTEIFDFYKKRFFRLYPLFFFNCLVLLLFFYKPSAEMLSSMVRALSTYSLFFGNDYMPIINWVLWSLMVEIWFSILFPLFLWAITKYDIKKVTIFFLILSFVCRILARQHIGNLWHYLALFKHLDSFMIGIFVCHIYYKSSWFEVLSKTRFLFIGIASFLLGCLITDINFPMYIKYFAISFRLLGFALVLLVGLKSDGKFSKFLSFGPLQLAGMMCFSLYVWHGVLIKPIIQVEFHAVDYLYYFIAVTLMAGFTYRYIEFGRENDWRKVFIPR